MKTLLFDIETTPIISYNWGIFDQNAIEVVKDWELLSVAYKWLGDSQVHCLTRKGEKTDKKLTRQLWNLLDSADVVIAHNGKQFDVKKSCAKFLEHGLRPPTPYRVVDTLELAKRQFRFTSNRLNDLGKLMGLGEKIKTDFDLWKGCMNNDASSWALMEKYNKKDVELLEKVYLRLRPWDTKHPNLASHGIEECPKCQSHRIQKRGFTIHLAVQYQRLQCQDCGGWLRFRVPTSTKRKRVVND